MANVLDTDDWVKLQNEIALLREQLQKKGQFDGAARFSDDTLSDMAREELQTFSRDPSGHIPVHNDLTTPALRSIRSSYADAYESFSNKARALLKKIGSEHTEMDGARGELMNETAIGNKAKAYVKAAEDDLTNSGPYKNLRSKHEIAKADYDHLHLQANRVTPRDWPVWPLIIILIVLGIVEFIINQPVFLDWLGQPIFALGATIAVALAVAWNSEVIGKAARQRTFLELRGQNDRWLFWITTIAFILAVVAVFWARFSYYWEALGVGTRSLDPGIDWGAVGEVVERVAPTLGFNFIIWLVGAAIAYIYYEKVPGLRETYRKKEKLHGRMINQVEAVREKAGKRASAQALDDKQKAEKDRQMLSNRMGELNGFTQQVEDDLTELRSYAQRQMNSTMGRYRRAFAAVDVDGLSPDLISFKANDARTYSINEFAAYHDDHKLPKSSGET